MKNIGAPEQVIQWVHQGVTIPFSDIPHSFELAKHTFSAAQVVFISSEIKELRACGAIEWCKHKPKYVSPVGVVPKQNRKLWLIHDLRRINGSCNKVYIFNMKTFELLRT